MPTDLESRLEAEKEYREVRVGYSTRFFQELRGGMVEKRPDGFAGVATEGWEDRMPDELSLFTAMAHRRSLGVLSVAPSQRRELEAGFDGTDDVTRARAVSACLWVEAQAGFPFKSIKKNWTADEVLKTTGDLRVTDKRHAAILDTAMSLERMGVCIRDGMFVVDFGKLSPHRLRSVSVSGLVERVRIPLFVLAGLDGENLETEESIINWFASFLKFPKMTKALVGGLSEALRNYGVEIGATVYSLDLENLNPEGIRAIEVPGLLPEGMDHALTLGDLTRLNGFPLTDEKSIRIWLESLFGERKVRAKDEKPVKKTRPEEEEASASITISSLLARFRKMRMTPEREREIIAAVRSGASIMEFRSEVAEGFQYYILISVLRGASRVHHFVDENIMDLFGEANLVVARRLPSFRLASDSDPDEGRPIKYFVFSCVSSAVGDAPRVGIIDGVRMTTKCDRVVLGHRALVLQALGSHGGPDDEKITLTLPPTDKCPNGRIVTFERGDLVAGLLKVGMKSGRGRSIDYPVDASDGGALQEVLRPELHVNGTQVMGGPAKFDEQLLVQKINAFLARVDALLIRDLDERRQVVIRNELRRRLGLEYIPQQDLAASFGVTQSMISHLSNQGAVPRRLARVLDSLDEVFSEGELRLLLGDMSE